MEPRNLTTKLDRKLISHFNKEKLIMKNPEIALSNDYTKIFSSKSAQELHDLARIKRFMERLVADNKFRKILSENVENPFLAVKQFGIEIDPLDLLPLWNSKFFKFRKTPECRKWPLAQAWDRDMDEMIAHRDKIRDSGDMSKINPKLNAWRERQIKRGSGELGASSASIVHPVIAYELSQGCTMGCWFCGISADSFSGNFEYSDENAALWQGVLKKSVEIFGSAAKTGFCYWGTDPCDNPDYDSFIHDHQKITGALPQTTTAAPLKDLPLTRRVMALHEKYMQAPNRFSVLTVRKLDEIHKTFTPDELMKTELVSQTKDALQAKAIAGRAMEKQKKLAEKGTNASVSNIELDHSTIACVSGFLVNMQAKTVQLIAPTRSSELWPKGYRIYDTHHFKTPGEFGAALNHMINAHMPESIPNDEILSFRSDIKYIPLDDGYQLKTKTMKITCTFYPFLKRMGELINKGTLTGGEVLGEMVSEGENIFVVSNIMQELYDLGLLNDDPGLNGIGSKKTALVA